MARQSVAVGETAMEESPDRRGRGAVEITDRRKFVRAGKKTTARKGKGENGA